MFSGSEGESVEIFGELSFSYRSGLGHVDLFCSSIVAFLLISALGVKVIFSMPGHGVEVGSGVSIP